MQLKVPYDGAEIVLEIPDDVEVATILPGSYECGEESEVMDAGFSNPIDHVGLEEFLEGGQHLLMIINDTSRPTPSYKVLERLEPLFTKVPKYTFIVACGTHDPPPEEGLRKLFGPGYDRWVDHIHIHRCREDEMQVLGKSPWGFDMKFNKLLFDADRVIGINSVEPHYFAGYTGGRKSLLPGIASFDTIENNHATAIRAEAAFLALDGNPVHEGMDSSLNYIPKEKLYSIQLVLDSSNSLAGIFAGEMRATLKEATKLANDIFCTPAKSGYDLVITCANEPFNINLYQSQKALEGGKLMLADGGTIVLVTEALEGIGPITFYELLSSSPDPLVILKQIDEGYKLGYHKAAKIVELATRAKILALSRMDEETLRGAHMQKIEDLQAVVDQVKPKRIAFLPQGAMTVPNTGC